MTQHTPWKVRADIFGAKHVYNGAGERLTNDRMTAEEDWTETAHTIAAAPDSLAALKDADACIQEEINLSNYDHQTVCRIAAMWDEAHGIIQAAIASAKGKTDE